MWCATNLFAFFLFFFLFCTNVAPGTLNFSKLWQHIIPRFCFVHQICELKQRDGTREKARINTNDSTTRFKQNKYTIETKTEKIRFWKRESEENKKLCTKIIDNAKLQKGNKQKEQTNEPNQTVCYHLKVLLNGWVSQEKTQDENNWVKKLNRW